MRHNAVKHHPLCIQVVQHLLSRGADWRKETKAGAAPLHGAAAGGNVRIVESLLAKRADANQADFLRRTPLFYAVRYNRGDVVRVLVEKGRADVTRRDYDEGTALHVAARMNYNQIGSYLIAQGADEEATDKDGRSPADVQGDELEEYDMLRPAAGPSS
jgi:ankyrin repeat protein